MSIYRLDDKAPVLPDSGDFWIAPNAQVMGGVVIGNAVGIWFGAVLRGDNEPIVIHDGTNIQENTIIHTDPGYPVTIGQNCTIGHGAIIHGCRIGDNSLIGMGATILNGAVIGQNCLIGAGALVTEGKNIPDGSLVVGAPAKIVRELDENVVKLLTKSAIKYQENMRRFRTNLTEISG